MRFFIRALILAVTGLTALSACYSATRQESAQRPAATATPRLRAATAPAADYPYYLDVVLGPYGDHTSQNQLLAAHKGKPIFVLRTGDLNRATWFANAKGFPIDRQEGAQDKNLSDPPAEWAVKANCRLLLTPDRYSLGDWKGQSIAVPLLLDIEGTSYNLERTAPKEARRKAMAVELQILKWCREVLGPDYEIWAYCRPQFSMNNEGDLDKEEKEYMALVAGVCWHLNIYDPKELETGAWFAAIQQADDLTAKYYPGRKRLLLVSPYWFVKGINNPEPAPLAYWRFAVDRARLSGWVLLPYLGGLPYEPVRKHFEYLSR